MCSYIGIDPGGTTAVSQIMRSVLNPDTWLITHGELLAEDIAYQRLGVIIDLLNPKEDIIEIENFIGGGLRSRDAAHTLRVIGFVEGYALKKGITVMTVVPQARKPYLGEAREIWDACFSGTPSRHAMDATAHALHCAAVDKGKHDA